MTHHDREDGRGRPMDRREEDENGYRGQPGRRMNNPGGAAAWDRGEYGGQGSYEGQGEYGGEGWWAQGEFPGQGRTQYAPRGYGEDYMSQGIGWQGGERFARGAEGGEERQFRGQAPGGYGQTYARMPEEPGYGDRAGSSQSWSRGRWGNQTRGQGSGGWEQRSGDRDSWDEGRSGRWDEPEGQRSGGQSGTGMREGVDTRYSGAGSWTTGPHSGRGPRGYRRSDARIEEDVYERLTHHGMLDATDIEVRVEEGVVVLSGAVESRQAKRIAEDILESISGLTDISNQLRVQGQGGHGESSQRVLNDDRQLGSAGQGQHQDQPQAGAETAARTPNRNQRGQAAKAGTG